ncbi:MAG: hypothetical protein GY953_56665 [bacterium]|nr:hypothetical protein [bacterium]
MWTFVFAQVVVAGAGIGGGSLLAYWVHDGGPANPAIILPLVFVPTFAVNGFLILSWGGDLIRPHLRRVSETARHACPNCGYLLTGCLPPETPDVVCPECGRAVPASLFQAPFRIPRTFLALTRSRR